MPQIEQPARLLELVRAFDVSNRGSLSRGG